MWVVSVEGVWFVVLGRAFCAAHGVGGKGDGKLMNCYGLCEPRVCVVVV